MKITNTNRPLNEETLEDTIKKADQVLDNPDVISNEGQIESILNRLLVKNKREAKHGGHNFQNVLFVGPAGTGKTSRIVQWAKDHNINLVKVLASTMDDTDLGGALSPDKESGKVAVKLASTEFDELDNVPDSVLFLDEFNRAPRSVRGTLLTLIQDHTIPDNREKGKTRYLKNFLFTIAAINPADANYNTDELDDAELSRFKRVDVYHDKRNTMNYLVRELDRKIADSDDKEEIKEYEGMKGIITALLSSREFTFDSPKDVENSKENGNGLITSARTLTNLLFYCDGTKDDFLDNWNDFCNSTKKSATERILSDYEDVQDKANDALAGGTESDIFKQHEESAWDKISKLL